MVRLKLKNIFLTLSFLLLPLSLLAETTVNNDYIKADNIKVDGNTISSENTNGAINLSPNGTGKVQIPSGKSIALGDDDSDYISLKAPSSVSAAYTLTLPTSAGTSGYSLTTNGSGTLSWTNVGTNAYYYTSASSSTLSETSQVINCNPTSANITYTLPPASTTTAGKWYTITKVSSSSAYNCIIDGNSSETVGGAATYTLKGYYESVTIINDTTNWKIMSDATPYKNIVIASTSTGSTSTTSSTYVDVANATVTITTRGRPVLIACLPDGSGNAGILLSKSSATSASADVNIVRDSTEIAYFGFSMGGASGNLSVKTPVSGIFHIDTPAAGTYTYKVQAKVFVSSNIGVTFCKLMAMEL